MSTTSAPIAPPLTRRRLLEALAALAVATVPAARALAAAAPAATATADPPTAAALVAAAAVLDDAAILDPTLGDAYLAGLVSALGEAPLARLVALVEGTPPAELAAAIHRAGLDPVANAVVASFYSGLTGAGGDARVVTYLFALVWGAAPFTKPPSLCGGMFGYWADPPPGEPSLLPPTATGTTS